MPTQTQTNATTASASEPSLIGPLPITPLSPSAILLVPGSITDAATKAKVDAKFNAALKEAIKQAIGSTNPMVGKFVDTLPLDYHALVKQTVLSVIKKIVAPAMLKKPRSPMRLRN
jgi:hypothetical protein